MVDDPDRTSGPTLGIASPVAAASTVVNGGYASGPAGAAVAATAGNPVISTITVQAASGDATFNLELDTKAAAAPASYTSGWTTAATLLSEAIHVPITVNIEIGYTEFPQDNSPIPSNLALGGAAYGATDSYSQVRSFLSATGAGDVVQALKALPNTGSLNGVSSFYVASAEEKIFGQIAGNAAAIDGYVGFGTGFGGFIVGAALHEFTHAMGRDAGNSVLSLFRYTSSGTHYFGDNIPAPATYFSIDGGKTALADFGENSDPADFLNNSLTVNDPFDELSEGNSLTALDRTMLDMLGFGGTSPPPPPPLGNRLAFFTGAVDATKINVVLTADGSDVAGKAIVGDYNIEVFTSTAGALASGFQASAFVQGAQLLTNNAIQAGSPTSTEQLLDVGDPTRSYTLIDLSSSAKQGVSIQVIGSSGATYSVFGSAGDTVTGSSNANVSQVIDASGTNPDANPGPFLGPETVTGGAGSTTVWGGKGDVITGGDGFMQVNDSGATGSQIVTGGAGALDVYDIGQNFSITGSTGGTTFINDQYGIGGNSKLTGGSGAGAILVGTNTFIFAEKGDQVTVGSATSEVDASKGSITVTGGDGSVTGSFGSAFNTVMVTGRNDQINLGAAPTSVDASSFASDGTTVTGGAGFGVVLAGKGTSMVGGAGDFNAIPIAGGSTVTGAAGNLMVFDIGKGETVTGSTKGTTFIDDSYGIGGNSKLTGGAGATTIIGAAGDTIAGGAGATDINAQAGSQTVTAGAGNATVQSGTGDSITAGAGTLQVFLNDDQGNATVSLGTGHGAASLRDISVTGGSTAQDSVTGFATAADVIQSKTSVNAGGTFLGTSASDGKGGTILTFLDGARMTLAGVSDPTKITFSQ